MALREMRTFTIVWAGQVISMLGSGMTSFALGIWVWEQTGQATALVLVGVSFAIPALFAKVVAGPLVDRWNRQRVMVVSDLAAGVGTLAILLLYSTGQLQIWRLYAVSAVMGLVRTFQGLAYNAALTMILPQAHYARARGMMSLGEYASVIGAPFFGGLLLSVAGLPGVLLADIATFLFAVGTLLRVRIPQPPASDVDERKPLWRDSLTGFRYIVQRPGLAGLMGIVFTFSLMESLAYPLITPMILARTGDEVTLGTVRAMQGVGGVVGGVLLTAWGGPKRRIHGVLIAITLTGLLGDALMGVGRSVPVWLLAAIGLEVFIPMALGSYFAIWQSKVTPALQGRVFAARDTVATLGEPVAMLLGGVLADTIFEPAMASDGQLASAFGELVGTGPGAGMGLVMVVGGLLSAGAGLGGYLLRPVREVETALPDHEVGVAAAAGD